MFWLLLAPFDLSLLSRDKNKKFRCRSQNFLTFLDWAAAAVFKPTNVVQLNKSVTHSMYVIEELIFIIVIIIMAHKPNPGTVDYPSLIKFIHYITILILSECTMKLSSISKGFIRSVTYYSQNKRNV